MGIRESIEKPSKPNRQDPLEILLLGNARLKIAQILPAGSCCADAPFVRLHKCLAMSMPAFFNVRLLPGGVGPSACFVGFSAHVMFLKHHVMPVSCPSVVFCRTLASSYQPDMQTGRNPEGSMLAIPDVPTVTPYSNKLTKAPPLPRSPPASSAHKRPGDSLWPHEPVSTYLRGFAEPGISQ